MATSMSPRDGGQYTYFAVVTGLGSRPFDTIEMVPSRERRAAGRAVALANCGPLVPECSLHANPEASRTAGHPESASRRTHGAPGQRRESAAASAPIGAPPCGREHECAVACDRCCFDEPTHGLPACSRRGHTGLSKHHAVYVCRCCFASPSSTAAHAAPASSFIALRIAGSMQQSGVGADTAGCRPHQ